jgi:hypothetical protein
MDVRVTGVTFANGTLQVMTEGVPASIEFIGQGGALRHAVRDVRQASYAFGERDTYVRATTMYLNPVLRYDGRALPAPIVTVAPVPTWMLRGGTITVMFGAALLLWPKRRSLPAGHLRAPLRESDRETA